MVENTIDASFTDAETQKLPTLCSVNEHRVGSFFIWSSEEKCWDQSLQLGAGRDQSLAMLVTLVLLEVLDEAASQILGLLLPLGSIGVGIAGIQDAGVNTVQDGGNPLFPS